MAEAESVDHQIGNGSIKSDDNTDVDPPASNGPYRQINLQRIRDHAQQLRSDAIDNLNGKLTELFDTFVTEVEQIDNDGTNRNIRPHTRKKERSIDDLPDKIFVNRRSVLTDLFEISHIQTIYHIFVAILVVFSLQTFIYDYVEKQRLCLDFDLIHWAMGKIPKVMFLWVCMQGSTLLIVYPAFYYWSRTRMPGPVKLFDYVFLGLFIFFEILFLVLPVKYVYENQLPPASSVIITCEQLRLVMKVHAFVRSNIMRVIDYKKDDGKFSSHIPRTLPQLIAWGQNWGNYISYIPPTEYNFKQESTNVATAIK
ncbi:sterol O-acyltransferase 1-like [Gigantopelta aegis]|uniref:sterol O-acyltransferase 1-like n=1 Tax=Gigantopelta aegis TaxID=1735272 RepID=UPI001B88AF93|nr:sterol O-acyltransferase 1-like [Gigantopelta aegis]